MKTIKAVLSISLAVVIMTSCNSNTSPKQINATQAIGTAFASVLTEISGTQTTIPIQISTPVEESPLINLTTTPFLTEREWKYEYIATVPIASVSDSTQEEIANILFAQWLNHFKTEESDLDHRLEDFELLNVIIKNQLSDGFVAMVSFSVKPTIMSSWEAGNGISDGVWVRKKLLFISIKNEKDMYRLVSMGTGP